MATEFKLRRGTTAEHATFTGAEGEVTVDLTKDTLVVHDGATAGGFPLARQDLSNVTGLPGGDLVGTTATQTLTNKTMSTGSVWNGGLITATYGGTGRDTLTANSLLAGNGTGTVNLIAPGTSGQVLTSNGTTWSSQALPPGGQYLGNATVKAIAYNAQTIGENITIGATQNGLSAGPITVDTGFEVTVATGGSWVII